MQCHIINVKSNLFIIKNLSITMNIDELRSDLNEKSAIKSNIIDRLFERIVRKRRRKIQEDKLKTNLIPLYPSEYKKFLLSHEERKNNYHCKMILSDSACSGCFKINPTEIIFRQFTVGNIYNSPLIITNIDKSSHIFRLTSEKNSLFDVETKKSLPSTKLAPGMSQSFNIKFMPAEKKDYHHHLDIVADCETFSIPIIAIGPRALLDFPDQIVMPETAVKIPSSKTFLIQNIGNKNTTFTSFSESEYFSINPEGGIVGEKDAVQFNVNFVTSNPGNFFGIIYLQYDTGELIRIDILANAISCNIYLKNDKLIMEDTYVGLSTAESLKIFNDSDYLIHFEWVKYKDYEADRCQKEKLIEIFGAANNAEKMRCTDLEYYEICRPEVHENICERIYADEVTSLLKQNFIYSDTNFSLTPMEGKILPRSFTNVIVDFQPISVGNLTSTAFLEVAGRVERIPIKFSGVSKGPLIKFKNPIINIGDIYINTPQNYQAVCKNEGLVTGTLFYKPKSEDYSRIIKVTPDEQEVVPEEFFSFNLTFSSSKLGQFTESVDFLVEESDEILRLFIRGNIILPVLNFDRTHLNCGTTALGFTSEHEITLSNDSPVSVKLSLNIKDGDESAVTFESFSHLCPHPASNPKEFSIKPERFLLDARSSRKIIINFTPNIARESNTILQASFDNFDSSPISLPIIYRSEVASLEIKPLSHVVDLCYINFPFTLHFTIKNESNIEGFAYKGKQASKNSAIFYSMSRQLWNLKPNESRDSSVTLIATRYGRQSVQIPIMTFGNLHPQFLTVAYDCQGASVLPIPTELDWGEVRLLKKQSLSFRLLNFSPVPAYFEAVIKNTRSPWSLSSTSGEIYPLKSKNITATIFMREAKELSDNLLVSILNSSTVRIVLKASGIGSPIIIKPNIFPAIDFGCFFSKQNNYLSLFVTNEGKKSRNIIFSSAEIKADENEKLIPSGTKFLMERLLIELSPRTKEEIKCLIHSEKPGIISEEWWIYDFFPDQKIYELVGKSLFTAKFIDLLINFDKNKLLFSVNIEPNREELSERAVEEIKITNASELNLQAHVSIRAPFSLLIDKNLYSQSVGVNLRQNLPRSLQICFTPLINDSQDSKKIYRDKLKFEYNKSPKIDEIECEASIIFPRLIIDPGSLQFDLILGSIAEKEIRLVNESPVIAYYHLFWADENIEYLKIKSASLTSVRSGKNSAMSGVDLENGFQIIKRKISEDRVENLIKLLPADGFIPPFSQKLITCTFYTQDPLLVKVKLFCQVLKGPLTCIDVEAKADIVRYNLSTKDINLGNKLIFKHHYENFSLKNVCSIRIDYKLEILPQEIENRTRIFSVDPKKGSIKSGETVVFTLQYAPIIPGDFEEFFYLDIENLSPIKIRIQGCGIFSQVYLALPWINKSSTCEEYRALQYFEDLKDGKKLNKKKSSILLISETELRRLNSNGWTAVDFNELPQVLDVNMAVKRHFALEFVRRNNKFLDDYIKTENLDPIPGLLENYILDLGYILPGQLTCHSLKILNYTSCGLFIRMKKAESEEYFSKQGITIKFEEKILEPSEVCVVEILINPSSKIFREEIKEEIFIEVANGCTASILITGIVTIPSLKVKVSHIDFENVFVGECKMTPLLIENYGLIECRWKIKLSEENNQSKSFYLIETEGITLPKQRIIINIHFKPHTFGYQETELVIFIEQSCEIIKVKLIGRGVERKLKISESSINFFANHHDSQKEHIFYIENQNSWQVEFFWEHLDKISRKERKISRALLDYYKTNEILLPRVKIGAEFPKKLYEFYNNLFNDAKTINTDKIILEEITDPLEKFDDPNNLSENSELKDSIFYDETENLIDSYINYLHKQDDFWKTRQDPVKEIFGDYYNEISIDSEKEMVGKICIVFYGAPLTFYQESACRAAKKINLPLINLNTAITEFIALKNSANAIKIKEIINQKYEELLDTVKNLLENSDILKMNDSISKEKLDKRKVKMKNKYLRYFFKPKIHDLIDNFQAIPGLEELNSMDPLSSFEYKIEGINLFELIINYEKKLRDKSSRKRRSKSKYVKSFLNINLNLFEEILQEILKSNNLRKGFVLQTLANNFIRNEVEVFLLITKNSSINLLFFINFHNSVDLYEQNIIENFNKVNQNDTELEKKISSNSKISELDLNLSFESEKILNSAIEAVEKNFSEAQDNLSAVNLKQEETESEKSICKRQENQNNLKRIKSQSSGCELVDKKVGVKKKKKLKALTKAFNSYNSNLKSILKTIDDWKSASDQNNAFRWHAKFSDPCDPRICDLIINQLLEYDFANKLSAEHPPVLKSEVFTVLTKRQKNLLKNASKLIKLYYLPNFSANENMPAVEIDDVEPRSVLQPGEVKYFKIDFNPENIGTFQQDFFLGVIGNDQTYKISVDGVVV